jgi:hypothetical protein
MISDEAHFNLDDYFSKQNVRFGFSEFPVLTAANPQHPERSTGWYALSMVGIFDLLFVDGTVTSDVYLSMLSDGFTQFLTVYDFQINSVSFQRIVQTLHRQCRTSLTSWLFRGESFVDPVSCAI